MSVTIHCCYGPNINNYDIQSSRRYEERNQMEINIYLEYGEIKVS